MKNKEYIDKLTLLNQLNAQFNFLVKEYTHYDHYTSGYGDALDVVDDFPIADVVEIIRCKDCKYFIHDDTFKYGECNGIDGLVTPNDNDYCSYGEKKNANA